EAGDHGLEVGILTEEIRIHRRFSKRVGALEPDAAAALRPQQADMTGEAGAPARLAAMVVHHRHAEMQLDIGHVEVGPGLEEAATFGGVRGHRPSPLAPVLRDAFEDPRNAGKRQAGEVRRVRGKAAHEIRMILQVLAATLQVCTDAMPSFASVPASPMPDSISSCGVWNAPAERSTSRRARICLVSLPCRYSTPTARF